MTVPGYLIGALAYVALMVLVFALATRTRPAAILASIWPRDPDRRLLATLLWGPLLLPALGAPLLSAKITSLWTMQAWFLLPVLLLAPESVRLTRAAAVRVAGAVAVFTLAAVLISPAMALLKHRQPTNDGRAYYSLVADELTRRWRETSTAP